MTPDLPIPDQVLSRLASILWRRCPLLTTKQAEEATAEMLAAALPHLRSLQVETQLEYGRALGRKEAAEEIAEAITQAGDARSKHRQHERSSVSRLGSVRHAAYLDAATIARNLIPQGQNATPEPRTDLPAYPSHPQDSQTAREAP